MLSRKPYRQHDFRSDIVDAVKHRPWPLPSGPWLMTQTWHDVLFAHWPILPDAMARAVPAGLTVDVFAGAAWLGVVPFVMTNVAPRGVPAVPGISAFPEVNVRTYVRVGSKPGVYFFSLDAGSAIAVQVARRLLNLPYYRAAMEVQPSGEEVFYASRRTGGRRAELRASYRPVGTRFDAVPATLDHFLTERYCLYARTRRGRLYRLEIHHPPWLLQRAKATFERLSLADAAGFELPDIEPVLHFARRQDMVAWAPGVV